MGTRLRKNNKVEAPERPLPNELTLALGANLTRLRKAAGLTQVELAFEAEVERSRISKLEGGHINPSLLTLGTLCFCLDVTLAHLFEGITATVPPVARGGTARRTNQAVVEPRSTRSSKG